MHTTMARLWWCNEIITRGREFYAYEFHVREKVIDAGREEGFSRIELEQWSVPFSKASQATVRSFRPRTFRGGYVVRVCDRDNVAITAISNLLILKSK